MNPLLIIIFIVSVLISILLFTKNIAKKNKAIENQKQLENEIRIRLELSIKKVLPSIELAVKDYQSLTNTERGYFSNYDLNQWFDKQLYLGFFEIKHFTSFIQKSISSISAIDCRGLVLSKEEKELISTYESYNKNGDAKRRAYNDYFIKLELDRYDDFFNKVQKKPLDPQQRIAIITDEDNSIVIAGAGSGKTTTIVGKVKYLRKRYKVKPSEILLISFTKQSSLDLTDRIGVKEIIPQTFHKFGKTIIAAVEKKQPSIFEEKQYLLLIKRRFLELINTIGYVELVTEYFINFLKPIKSQFDFEHQGEYIQYLKDYNFRTYKSISVQSKTKVTQRMEVVKSMEECKIANFLFFNGIEYQYEYPYEHNTGNQETRHYKPDFTIFQNGKKIYLEHFGINRNGDVPNWFRSDGIQSAKEVYTDGMRWKRKTHQKYNTTLVETYSYEMFEGTLFDNLKKKLEANGIVFTPLSNQEIWSLINDSAEDEVKSFINLFATFITLMKSNNYSIEDVKKRMNNEENEFFKTRSLLFLEIISPIYSYYQSYLTERGEIDFSDMINLATKYIQQNKYKKKYKYIIIDEFQDISIGRYELVNALKSKNLDCKLFCVGDDWQSIYRFSGSDIALFKDFEKHFGVTEKLKIETTYRFHNPLIQLSSDFILKNPNQTEKTLRSGSKNERTNFQIVYSQNTDSDDTDALIEVFVSLIKKYKNIESKEIKILGRYGFDVKRIKDKKIRYNDSEQIGIRTTEEGIIEFYSKKEQKLIHLKANFSTVHKSKGLEADIVIILNCNSGKLGFPSELSDDEVLNFLLSSSDSFENGEERRVFYVAMTRAKEELFFIANAFYKSKFINELELRDKETSVDKCPSCKTGELSLKKEGTSKKGHKYKFYGCSNYLYGCDYTYTAWENNNDDVDDNLDFL